MYEQVYKPCSVLSIIYLGYLLPNTSSDLPLGGDEQPPFDPFWSCSGWGLQSQLVSKLLVSSYLTFPPLPKKRRYISVALSLKSPLPVISRHSVLWCSDFPHFAMRLLGHLMLSNNIIIRWLKSQCIRQYKIDFSNKNVQHTLHINN